MPARPHLAVKLAQKATLQAILDKLSKSYRASSPTRGKQLEVPLGDTTALLEMHTTKTLPSELQTWIWDLFECNMRSLYESTSEGYDASAKRKELFHPDSRFVVLRSASAPSPDVPKAASSTPLGYSIFRFDTEETASDDDELCDVVYCYELQVAASAQGRGVGRILMEVLGRVGSDCKMDKVMLTVFKANTSAISFYEKIGFSLDEIDPSEYEGGDSADYTILSKPCT
ncbi:hypothetical protein JCM1840_000058 [Sporobolomyces johnsonii]